MPRSLWEACGTSGMKVQVNGGVNLAVLDRWWDEAYAADVGWTIKSGPRWDEGKQDESDAEQPCAVLEREIVPESYDRDASGVRAWLARRLQRAEAANRCRSRSQASLRGKARASGDRTTGGIGLWT
jgi:starch phosphorylase